MKKPLLTLLPLAASVALVFAMSGGVASAQDSGSTTYTATLASTPLNGGTGSGTFSLTLNGNQATITEQVTGLADKLPTDLKTLDAVGIPEAFAGKPFPHVQHIHINGQDTCPTASADTNKDGVITTPEGQPAYGMIGTTLSVSGDTSPAAATDVTIAPGGGSFTYNRTITLDQPTMQAIQNNKAVIVVHGLDPATAPPASLTTPSPLKIQLPGATKPLAVIGAAPTLCGVLQAQAPQAPQMKAMPKGGTQTGGGSTSGIQDEGLIVLGGGLVAAAALVLVASKLSETEEVNS